MIIEKIMKNIIIVLLSALPSVPINISWELMDNITSLLYGLNYLLPLDLFISIIGIKLSLKGARIVMAILIRLKSLIPTMGA